MSRFETRRNGKLKKLADCQAFVAASISEVKRTCGKPNCKCARGEPHRAHVLTYKVEGKTKTVHVPKDLLEDVQAWVKEHKRIKKIIQEVSQLSMEIIRNHVQASRAAKRSRKKHQI